MKRILPLTIMVLVSAACLAQKPCSLPKVKGLDKKYSDAVDLLSENQDLGIKYLNEISIDYPKYYPATLLLGEYYLNKQRDAQLRFQTDRALEFSQKAQRNLSLSFEFCPTHDSCRAGFYLGPGSFACPFLFNVAVDGKLQMVVIDVAQGVVFFARCPHIEFYSVGFGQIDVYFEV